MALSDLEAVMVPADRAAQIAGISRHRLRYWEDTKLITPTYRKRLSPRWIVRLYDLQRLTELKVAAQLVVSHGVTVQSLRPLLKFLRQHYDAPLATLRYGTYNRRVFWNDGTGWWGGPLPQQGMFQGTLNLDEIRTSVRRAVGERAADQVGRIVKVRGVQGSAPVFEGTRIPLTSVWDFLAEGEPVQAILEAYPDLEERDVRKAKRMRDAAQLLKAGATVSEVRQRFADLSDDEVRSLKQLKRVA